MSLNNGDIIYVNEDSKWDRVARIVFGEAVEKYIKRLEDTINAKYEEEDGES